MTHRVAIVTDIHGNLPALEAALDAIDRAGCETIYCLGDVIGIGPFPAECLDVLNQRPDVRPIMGNHDAWFAFGLPDPQPTWMTDGELAHHHWIHAQLNPDLRPVIAQWPWVREERIDHLPVTLLHYPRDESQHDFAPVEQSCDPVAFDALFATYPTPLVFFGHHHPVADIAGNARYVNPGSLGCSPDDLARFCLLDVHPDGAYTVEMRTTPYDRHPLIQAFTARNVPERALILAAFFGHPESQP